MDAAVTDRAMLMPVKAAVLWVSLGLVVFGGLGAVYGRFEDPIKEKMQEIVLEHPSVLTEGGGEAAPTETQTAPVDQAAAAGVLAEEAWGRLKFFHGHGFSMVLASFVVFLLIANLSIQRRRRVQLTWIGLVSMTLYNIGWFFAGVLAPYMGLDDAKKVGEYLFFIPFGVITVAVWTITFVLWVREYRLRPAGASV